jgi:hypothetical protein
LSVRESITMKARASTCGGVGMAPEPGKPAGAAGVLTGAGVLAAAGGGGAGCFLCAAKALLLTSAAAAKAMKDRII